jgi:hypothetical protein
MHGPIGEEHEFLQAYQAQYDEIPQPSEMEPRAESGRRRKALDVKSRTVRPKVGDLRLKV